MTGLFIVVHVLMCAVLILIILAQSGRGGGLTESFASAESVFGAKTNEFMVKATAIAGTVFLVTSLSLAYLSAQGDRSLMADQMIEELPIAGEEVVMPDLPDGATSPEADPIRDRETPIKAQTTREVVR